MAAALLAVVGVSRQRWQRRPTVINNGVRGRPGGRTGEDGGESSEIHDSVETLYRMALPDSTPDVGLVVLSVLAASDPLLDFR
jgi:hypothetical protein